MPPAWILFGAAFEGLTALALGLLCLQWLGLRLYRGEVILIGFLLGSTVLSTGVFLMLSLWIARPWWFAVVGTAAIGACLWRRSWRVSAGAAPHVVPVFWRRVFLTGLIVCGSYTFLHAMAPESSPDGVAYHLAMVGRYFRAGGFEWYTGNMYANMPMGADLLFLYAYAFGRHSAAALVHWQFLILLPLLLLACGRRFGFARAGAVAGLLVVFSPVVAVDGASAYVDVATSAVVFGMFLALLIWEQERSPRWLIVAGALAGFAYACKMTAAPAIPLALGFACWRLWTWGQPPRKNLWNNLWKPVLVLAAVALAVVLPWLLKNSLLVGNPFSPFLNRYFPNPYVRISFEEEYRASHRDYYGAIKSWREIPLEVTARGATLNGLLGPVFLLAPLGLLALRWPLGRRLWIAAAILGLTYPSNIGTRFLITPLPFVALAMAMMLSRWSAVALAVILFHGYLSWPDVIPAYGRPYVWRLDRVRWSEAWRITPEQEYLSREVEGYNMARLVEKKVPLDGRVFTFGGVAEAYTTRDISIAYQSGLNNAAGEMLAAGLIPHLAGKQARTWRFEPRMVRRIRLVQTATSPEIWSLSEVRVLRANGEERARESSWRIRASPNPWDVQWAFDNCPITRWKTWQRAEPGQFVEIDFLEPVEVGGLRAEVSFDQGTTAAKVEIETLDGRWVPVSTSPEIGSVRLPPNLRRTAMDDLRRLGFTHLIVAKGEFHTDDTKYNYRAWGLTFLGDTGNARLYKIN